MINKSIEIIKSLQYPSGLFSASRKDGKTGYHLTWLRDNMYIALGLEKTDPAIVRKTYRALLDVLRKHELKIDAMIAEPRPKEAWRYIHARYHPTTKKELPEQWGNKQNDTIGGLLFKIGQLQGQGFSIIRNKNDTRIIQKLVDYLVSIEYWHDADSGMWEENEEIHSSSIGACVAGLQMISPYVVVPPEMIKNGRQALQELLPRESATKKTDLALLSLIYPFNIVSPGQRAQILTNIEKHLVRKRGVNRYVGDQYYNNGAEAEWVVGFPWLAIIYKQIGNHEKHLHYFRKTLQSMNDKNELPELFFGESSEHNENSPLGWAQALYVVAATA